MGTPQEHALMCDKHDLMPIDMTCEDCEEFICSKCVKEDHKDHDWITISTAATLRTRGLLKTMTKIEKEDIKQINRKIQEASQQMDENKKRCENEVLKLQKHYDVIMKTFDKIENTHEKILMDCLESKNANVRKVKSGLEEKKKKVLQHIKSMKENGNSMTDIILIKTHRELTKLISTKVDYEENSDFLSKHEDGKIIETVLESIMGRTFDAEKFSERDSFQWSDQNVAVFEAINEDTCLIKDDKKSTVEQINKSGKKEKQFSVNVGDVCVADNNDVYVTDLKNNSISRLSPSGSVSAVFSTDPLLPMGICQTKDGGLLVTLRDTKSNPFQPNSDSRRLVRQVTLTGDVIHEYEYQEDGQTRLFTVPWRVTQNSNTDICAINVKSETCSELVILSFSGSLKSVYPEQNIKDNFVILSDVVCDSFSNIIVSEAFNSSVHLLSPDGQFMRYLLTENQVNQPTALSLKKSTLWIGDKQGHIKVFHYKP